jgi:hypothetical protein
MRLRDKALLTVFLIMLGWYGLYTSLITPGVSALLIIVGVFLVVEPLLSHMNISSMLGLGRPKNKDKYEDWLYSERNKDPKFRSYVHDHTDIVKMYPISEDFKNLKQKKGESKEAFRQRQKDFLSKDEGYQQRLVHIGINQKVHNVGRSIYAYFRKPKAKTTNTKSSKGNKGKRGKNGK